MAYTLVPTELIVDGAVTSAKLDTNIAISGTLGVTGELTLATHMIMGDNDKIKIGTGGDLEIYHDGSNSYISNSTGNIYLADTNGSVHIQAKLNEESIVCTADGAVTLYHDNAVKLATSSAGVSVTGTVTADGLIVDGNNDIQINRDGVSAAKIFWNRSGTTDAFLEVDSGENLTLAVDEAQLGSRLLLLRNNQTNVVSVSSSGIDVTGTVTADGLIVDTSTLVVDSTNNRVGIGTTSPAGSGLHIRKDTLATTNELLRLSNSAGSTTDGVKIVMEVANTSGNGGEIGVVRDSGSFVPYMFFSTSSGVGSSPTEAMRIDSDARLAINNTTSAADSNINDQVKLVCGGGVVVGSAAATNNSFLQYTDAGGLTILQGSGSYGLRIFDDNSSTPRLTVFRSGNVGINNNSPENKLQVDVSSSSEGTDSISVQNSGVSSVGHTTGLRFRFSSAVPSAIRSRLTNTSNGAGTLSFYTSPDGTAGNLTERMTIDNSGSLMVGVTSPVSNATQTIYKSNLDYGLFIRKGDGTTGSTNKYIGFDISGGGTTGGSITNSSAGNAQFTATSDERLKENIEDVTGCLDKVMALKPSSYTLKENNLDVPYGFIAQNVETVLPEFVSENEQGYKQISDGLTSGYIAVLTKAIQEQQTIIDDLKSRIETLENE